MSLVMGKHTVRIEKAKEKLLRQMEKAPGKEFNTAQLCGLHDDENGAYYTNYYALRVLLQEGHISYRKPNRYFVPKSDQMPDQEKSDNPDNPEPSKPEKAPLGHIEQSILGLLSMNRGYPFSFYGIHKQLQWLSTSQARDACKRLYRKGEIKRGHLNGTYFIPEANKHESEMPKQEALRIPGIPDPHLIIFDEKSVLIDRRAIPADLLEGTAFCDLLKAYREHRVHITTDTNPDTLEWMPVDKDSVKDLRNVLIQYTPDDEDEILIMRIDDIVERALHEFIELVSEPEKRIAIDEIEIVKLKIFLESIYDAEYSLDNPKAILNEAIGFILNKEWEEYIHKNIDPESVWLTMEKAREIFNRRGILIDFPDSGAGIKNNQGGQE